MEESMDFMERRHKTEQDLRYRIKEEVRFPSRYWLYNAAMRWLMNDPELRANMLYFIDVFPALSGAGGIHQHMLQYFGQGPFSSAIKALDKIPCGHSASAFTARAMVNILARHFILSPDDNAVIRTIKKLQRDGIGYSLDILGEAVVSELEAEQYMAKYLNLADMLSGFGCRVDFSVKLSSLYSQFDPLTEESSVRMTTGRLKDVLRRAQENGGTVTIDTEQYYVRDLTIKILEEILMEDRGFTKWGGLGIAQQAYLKDSKESLEGLMQFAKENDVSFFLRLVKGAYWDYEVAMAQQKGWPVPVYEERRQTDESFESNISIALENYPRVRVAVGSHNLTSIAYAIAKQQDLGLPQDALEIQVLHGLGGPLVNPIRKMGYSVRVYIGVGNLVEGMSFMARRLLENTSQTSSAFFAR